MLLAASSTLSFSQTKGKLKINITSIYVHQYEKSDTILGLPIFAYNCSIWNKNDSSITVTMRHYPFEDATLAKCFLVYKRDTIPLFFGQKTPTSLTILAKQKTDFDLVCKSIKIIDLIEGRPRDKSEVDFLVSIAKESELFISWPPYKKRFSHLKDTKIIYRSPNDFSID